MADQLIYAMWPSVRRLSGCVGCPPPPSDVKQLGVRVKEEVLEARLLRRELVLRIELYIYKKK